MVQVLPYVPSFGEKLSETIANAGTTLGQGYLKRLENQKAQTALGVLQDPSKSPMQKVSAFMTLPERLKKSSAPIWAAILGPQAQAEAQGREFERFKADQFGGLGNTPSPIPQEGTNGMVGTSPEQLPNAQQMQGEALPSGQPSMPQGGINPNDIQTWPDQTLRQLSSMEGAAGRFAKSELDRRETEKKYKTRKEEITFNKNEPHLIEISEKLRNLDIENARFQRLDTLFQDPSKFPSAVITALFSKDGQLNPVASALLSPEAQEAVKLIQDQLSGAKDTFGARVTNFDVSNFLKRLPSLMNTPEGRERVLRDLMAINDINRRYYEGVLDIIDEKGGSDQISFSSAERLWKKRNHKYLDDWTKKFVNPEGNFKSLPSAAAYQGRKIKNNETGEVFISNGKDWRPVEE
jgi:hypothetical protein